MAQPPKRKQPPDSASSSQRDSRTGRSTKRQKVFQDARAILTQTSDAALNNGELDLRAFLKAREYEIKALENGMQKSKSSRNERAFQSVPRDMRRRTASHNVKRVPKRLQKRANKEMREDNTPTVTPNKRKPGSSRGRLRAETAKRLGLLAAKKKATKGDAATGIITRAARPKIRTDKLNDPPKPIPKFRKRQTNKTWLPTHLWHAKRATMTEPKNPLWRFAMPITSTEKSYRPTHTASRLRGAVTWDTSYMSTIRLAGPIESLQKVLQGIGISQPGIWEATGEKWRAGKRSRSEWLSREVQGQRVPIGPATMVWCADEQDASSELDIDAPKETKRPTRQVLVRLHPSAFLETWTELLRLSKQQRPVVRIEDLRWEIGSIEMTGPGSTEALMGILHPCSNQDGSLEAHGKVFTSLAGLTNSASLPTNSLLSFSIMDPRLHYPPQPLALPCDQDALLRTLSSWPADDTSPAPSGLFDRDRRFKATKLPSQKALNRRKTMALGGKSIPILPTDPQIPIILLASRPATSGSAQGNWTLLAPWKCILPIWHGLVHFPLTTGGNPRFGGLDEIRQVHFENGIPWFPADFPGTNAGYMWEVEQRAKRKKDWDSRPKGKRIEWGSLDLGAGRKGEIGLGWSCDFEKLLGLSVPESLPVPIDQNVTQEVKDETLPQPEPPLRHLPGKDFTPLLSKPFNFPAPNAVSTIRITLISRGVVTPCARIYRLPRFTESSQSTESITATPLPLDLRQQWVSLLTPSLSAKNRKSSKASRIPPNTPHPLRVRLLAESLLDAPAPYPPTAKDEEHPLVPDDEDLIGFVTTGQYNLSVGHATAIGSVLAAKVVEGLKRDGKGKGGREAWLCIVRNAGEKIGRLGKWEVV